MKKLSIFLIFLIVFSFASIFSFQIKNVYATITYLNDDFESFNTKSWWTLANGNGAALPIKTSEQEHGGSYSVVWNTTTNGYSDALNGSFNPPSNYHVSVWFRIDSSNLPDYTDLFDIRNSTLSNRINIAVSLWHNSTGNYLADLYYGISFTSIGTSISNDTWHHLDLYINRTSTGNAMYFMDSVLQYTNLGLNYSGIYNVLVDRFYFGDLSSSTSSPTYNGKIFYDDLLADDNMTYPPTGTSLSESGSISINQSFVSQKTEALTINGLVSVAFSFLGIFSKTRILYEFGEILVNILESSNKGFSFSRWNLINIAQSFLSGFPFQIGSIEIVTVNIGFDGTFFLLVILFIVCLILSAFRIPIIGFVFSSFTIAFAGYATVDTSLPLFPMLNVFVAVMGSICLYLNIDRFKSIGQTKKQTSKLAKRGI